MKRTVISAYRCPSDPGRGNLPWVDPSGTRRIGPQPQVSDAPTNYFGSIGHDTIIRTSAAPCRGMLVEGRINWNNQASGGSIALADFIDGTSNTLAVAEGLIGHPSSRTNSTLSGTPDNVTNTNNGCGPTSILGTGGTQAARGASWFRGYEPSTIAFTTLMTPNSKLWDCGANTDQTMFAARSLHPGGVQATMADGSTQFFSQTIDFNTWKFLGGTKDGVPVSVP